LERSGGGRILAEGEKELHLWWLKEIGFISYRKNGTEVDSELQKKEKSSFERLCKVAFCYL